MASSYVNHFGQVLLGNSIAGRGQAATELMRELEFRIRDFPNKWLWVRKPGTQTRITTADSESQVVH